MKVLQVISSGGMYGAERVVLALAVGLSRLGHECTIAVFANRHRLNLELADRARALGLAVEHISCDGRLDRRALQRVRSIVHSRRIDVVHAHGFKADIYSCAALRSSSTPLVSTCHNWLNHGLALSLYGVCDRFALRYFDAIVAVSPAVKLILERSGVPHNKIEIVDNGIDFAGFESAKPALRAELGLGDALVIGFVGRLSPEKGLKDLLRAASSLFSRWESAKLVFVGAGPEEVSLTTLANELGIGKRTHFLGQRSDMPDVYASLDVLALPSATEGLPLTLLEALASRRAVVASSVGAVPDVVVGGSTGLLIAPGDVRALADAIELLLRDPTLRRRLGEEGRALVLRRYSASQMTNEYATVYQNAMMTRSSQG
ncbi:glycosyltransferase family 4 protein [Acidobacteria bacterium AB60]|nr:glycosyltransferase family 4 protein [Acidobacteria bacterium AB60]